MTQQINLFSDALRQKRKAPAVAWALLLMGVVTGASLGYYGYADAQVRAAQARNDRLDAELSSIEEQLRRIKPAPTQASSQALLKSIAETESEIKTAEAVLSRLSGGRLASRGSGLSEYMSALARQRQQGIWITGLRVNEGDDFTIRGGALSAEMLPEYIRRLGNEDVLRGKPIAGLQMQRRDVEVRETGPPGPAQRRADAPPQRLRFVEFAISSAAGGAALQGG